MLRLRPVHGNEAVFASAKARAWRNNTEYWLSARLRHVDDIGEFLVSRTTELISTTKGCGAIVDMGCGSAWFADQIAASASGFNYLGLDFHPPFVEDSSERFDGDERFSFKLVDFEAERVTGVKADLVVNFFNFFELANLKQAMENVASWLNPGGVLAVATIDKTFLLLAASRSWDEFHELLRQFSEVERPSFLFQPIDTGDSLSSTLEYPSVFYSLEDYCREAENVGLKPRLYREFTFTHKPLPKIYNYLELVSP